MLEPNTAPGPDEGDPVTARWWGTFSMEPGEARRWQIGPLSLWLARADREWRVTHRRGDDPFEPTLAVAEPAGDCDEIAPDIHRVRFGFRSSPGALRVLPALPDRPIVVKPEVPIFVPSGEEVRLFISVPLWIGVHLIEGPTRLYETPVFRPSDTWFGPPAERGGCCYASRTRARVSLENVALLPHRAALVVRIRNHAESALPLERIRLPSPNLSLFASENGQLWTETITLDRREQDQSAAVDLERGPSPEAGETELVMGPREPLERDLLLRTFDGLF